MSTLTTHGFGLAVRQQNSGLEGAFGLGFVLGTNLTLDVQTLILTRVLRNTPYTLSYTDPADGQPKSLSLLHDPDVPYQGKFPENTLLTLTVPASATYQALTASLTIAPNTAPVLRVRLAFQYAYARATVRFYH